MGAAVLPEVLHKTLGLLQECGSWFTPETLLRYEESNLNPESSWHPPRELETSAGITLLSEWGYVLTSRWDRWNLVRCLHGQTMQRVVLLNSDRNRSCVGISFLKGVTQTAGKVRLKSCDCPARPSPHGMAPFFCPQPSRAGFSLEVTGYVSCGSFSQSLHCDILSLPASPLTAVIPPHCLA